MRAKPQRSRRPGRWRREARSSLPLAVFGLALWLLAGGQAPSQPPAPVAEPPIVEHVAGSAGHVWIVRRSAKQADDRFELLHRSPSDEPGVIYREMAGQGKLSHVAAVGSSLWLLYDDRSVQSLRYVPATRSTPRTLEVAQRQPLPPGGEVTGWVASDTGPAALVRHGADAPARGRSVAGPPSGVPSAAADADGATAAKDESAAPPIELLELEAGGWTPAPLPRALRPELVRGFAVRGAGRYVLVSDHRPTQALTVHSYEPVEPEAETPDRPRRWSDRGYGVAFADRSKIVAVGEGLYLVQESRPQVRWRLNPYKLHQGQTRLLGPVDMLRPMRGWWAVAGEESLVFLCVDDSGAIGLAQRRVDDGSYTALAAEPLLIRTPSAVLPQSMAILVALAMGTGIVFLLSGPRREPDLPVMVPRGTRPLLLARALAAALDLLPALAVAMIVHRVSNPLDIAERWINDPDGWDAMKPLITVLALYLLHTVVIELLTGASFGKLVFNLRVVSMTGMPPSVGQVLLRNLFKIVEFMPPWVLLLMPLLSHRYRQRMGDMVARTLVVGPDPEAERRRRQEEEELFGEGKDDDQPPDDRP